jgi:hypothetical protein
MVLLQGTSALQCNAGVIGATVGQANDTILMGVYIVANATAATLTVGGLVDSNGAAATLLVSGLTTQDYFWMPPAPILNSFAAFTFTPSIAGKIFVETRAYIGPERPETRINT